MSRDKRIYDRERLKKKRKNYWGFNQQRGAATERQLGMLVDTPKPCSCFLCRNRRKSEGDTLQEKRNED